MDEKIKDIVSKMSLIDKAKIVSGKNFWETRDFKQYGIESFMMTDGPHGLRKQAKQVSELDLNKNEPSTCFPTASASACSFDKDLLFRMGQSLGDKCIRDNVSVILGPGVNIKRNPLCGRNFEYFSEDPYLAGEMAASLINGIQSKNVGASLKHFAANNQEFARMCTNANVDIRALREIYLTAFEIAVKKSQPYTIMCSYNKINGIYSSSNKWLLSDVLRDEWKYNGLVVTDWGALEDPIKGIKAGCDLEMPSSGDYNANKIVKAVEEGKLSIEDLDKCVARNLDLYFKQNIKKIVQGNEEDDNKLAREVASNSAVLLKNDNHILPLNNEEEVIIIGDFAKNPRYQGAGSSLINPSYLDNIFDSAIKENKKVSFVQGYINGRDDDSLIEEAVKSAKGNKKVVIVAGLPSEYEGEGYDRDSLNMPLSHIKLINEVSKVNNNVIVVLQGGAPFDLSWRDNVKGILLMYLSGQAGGSACVDLLWGKKNPSGKLAETWPVKLEDCPSSKYFPGEVKAVQYRESIYVGYRYFDTVNMNVFYPFGYGLSYTDFKYNNLSIIDKDNNEYIINVDITNIGPCFGKEIVQLYISKKDSKIFRAKHELKGFEKVSLNPNETKTISFSLNKDSFRYFNSECNEFAVEGGEYIIEIGKSSRDIVLSGTISVIGDGKEELLLDKYAKLNSYYSPSIPFNASLDQFETLLGYKACDGTHDSKGKYTTSSTLLDINDTLIGKIVIWFIKHKPGYKIDDCVKNAMKKRGYIMYLATPIRSLGINRTFTINQLEGLVEICNGHLIKGIRKYKKKQI